MSLPTAIGLMRSAPTIVILVGVALMCWATYQRNEVEKHLVYLCGFSRGVQAAGKSIPGYTPRAVSDYCQPYVDAYDPPSWKNP